MANATYFFSLEGDFMHMMIVLILILASLFIVYFCDGLPFIISLVILVVSISVCLLFFLQGDKQLILSENTVETYTLIGQAINDDSLGYVVIDGDVAHFTYRDSENGIQFNDADMNDVSVYYQDDGKTVTVSYTCNVSRKVWLFFHGFMEKTEEHHYDFYVPEGSIIFAK